MISRRGTLARVPDLRPVILSGGAGTRLWPLSTPTLPKQFAPLIDNTSLFAATMRRLVGLDSLVGAIVVTGEGLVDLVNLEVAGASITTSHIVVEPEGRNTAPAALAAALLASDGDILMILPSDQVVRDDQEFRRVIGTAASLAQDDTIVTLGVPPSRPETGFGYIQIGSPIGEAYEVARFHEKPAVEEAGSYLSHGSYLWNSGVFVVRAGQLLAEARKHCPQVLDIVTASLTDQGRREIRLGPEFLAVEAVSLDNAIMEKTDGAVVVPLNVGWDDLGSYRSLLEASDRDSSGNHVSGDAVVVDVTDSLIRATSRRVVVAGLDEVVVVETPEAVLVISIDRAQDVRDLQKRKTDD